MSQSATDVLRRAQAYLQAGRPQLARPMLVEYVRQFPTSEEGWLLLSQAVTEQQQKIDCLQRVLRINPANAEAQTRLKRLLAPPDEPPPIVPLPPHIKPMTPSEPAATAVAATASRQLSMDSPQPDRPGPPSAQPEIDSLRVAAQLTPTPSKSNKGLTRKQRIILGVTALAIFAVIGLALVLVLTSSNQTPSTPAVVADLPTALPAFTTTTPTPAQKSLPQQSLPPTWTPTPLPSVTPTRTAMPYPTLNSTISTQMDRIEQQVADLRGLSSDATVPRRLIRKTDVESMLKQMLIAEGYLQKLPDLARSLSALGLIKPTYDLTKYALNGLADNIGGFYIPWLKQLFVIGTSFYGLERFVFSHEYDHALTDQHFNIDQLGVYPDCLSDGQRCAAIKALVEGDATLLMQEWLQQYAGPLDYQDIIRYQPPSQTLPEDFPPPYVSRDLAFSYEAGLKFVQYLHRRGNWAAVNKAYTNLPASTEQILHPEKYVAAEQPIEVATPPLTDTLGSSWRLIDDDVLGEWTTYLILRAGADVAAQLDETTSLAASRGWGGDHYQVYYNDALSQTVLAAEWVWDTPRATTEFKQALTKYLDERYRGAKLDRPGGDCWDANHQTSCLFVNEKRTLWLLAPDSATLDKVLAAYPDF
jgi:hypothetical protein